MTRAEAEQAIKEGSKVTHEHFTTDEFVTLAADGTHYEFEDGCLCEKDEFWYYRQGESFNDGWALFN